MKRPSDPEVRTKASLVILGLAIIFSILCFIPIFISHHVTDYDDYIYRDSQDVYFRQAAISCLIICVVPGFDLLMEWLNPQWAYTVEQKISRLKVEKSANDSSIRMNKMERTAFILGVITIGGNAAFPVVFQHHQALLIYYGFANLSTPCIMGSILSMLCRVSPSWTPLRAIFVQLCVCLSSLLGSLSAIETGFDVHGTKFSLASTLLMFCAGCLFFIFSLLAFRGIYPTCFVRNAIASETQETPNADAIIHGTFRRAVFVVYMCVGLAVLVIQTVWITSPYGTNTVYAFTAFIYSYLAVTTIVFVAELRVRKVEMLYALFALVDAKKSYVRYISHEMRTPLNAATLGLNMLATQLKKKNNPTSADLELYESISDIQLACSTAVDILNDLLSFEKLESGILVLHRQDISVPKFMSEGVVMFSAQAKEKDVFLDLTFHLDAATTLAYPGAVPLRNSDIFSCDRFKMDQVFRNLVSNAIKFSPEGGTIVIRAFFQKEDLEQSNPSRDQSCEHSRHRTPLIPLFLHGSTTTHAVNDLVNVVPGDNHTTPASLRGIRGGDAPTRGVDSVTHGNLIIVVSDSGPGINEENQKKLFRSVVQFDPEKNQGGGGSGFGLYISKGIVDLHDGTISVYSEGEGHGCSFILSMPMTRCAHGLMDVEDDEIVLRPAHPTIPQLHPTIGQERSSVRNLIAQSASVHHQGDRRSSSRSAHVGLFDSVKNLLARNGAGAAARSVSNNLNRLADAPSPPHTNRVKEQPSFMLRRKYQLLIVDDSGLNRKMLCKALRAAGHLCDEAADGLLALNKVKHKLASLKSEDKDSARGNTSMYDAILMDSNMPVMDGPASASAMRALGVTIPIFGVTGNGSDEDIQHYMSHGATEVLVKPLDITAFLGRMKLLPPILPAGNDGVVL